MSDPDPEREFWENWFDVRQILYGLVSLLVLVLFCCGKARGQSPARFAVVAVPSHGGSATVISTTRGKSLLLSSAHMFEGASRSKAIRLAVPVPVAGSPERVGVHLVDVDYESDLSLIDLGTGPLPYCAPVAPAAHLLPRNCLSVGYDELKFPPQMRQATIVGKDQLRIYTRERPWHGRSGGALLDDREGWLIGVVQGYETTGQRRGIYAGHDAVVAFLRRNRIEPTGGQELEGLLPRQQVLPPDLYWPRPPAAPQRMFPGRLCPT